MYSAPQSSVAARGKEQSSFRLCVCSPLWSCIQDISCTSRCMFIQTNVSGPSFEGQHGSGRAGGHAIAKCVGQGDESSLTGAVIEVKPR